MRKTAAQRRAEALVGEFERERIAMQQGLNAVGSGRHGHIGAKLCENVIPGVEAKITALARELLQLASYAPSRHVKIKDELAKRAKWVDTFCKAVAGGLAHKARPLLQWVEELDGELADLL